MPELPFPAAVRVALFLLTMFVTAMGVFLCVRTDLVLTPTDGIVKTISEVFHVVFSRVKNGFDITLVAVSALLCLVNHAPVLRHRRGNRPVRRAAGADYPAV